MRSAEEADFKAGDLVRVEHVNRAMPSYPAFVVSPEVGSAWPSRCTSVVAAHRPGSECYWVDTDRLELVQRGGQ